MGRSEVEHAGEVAIRREGQAAEAAVSEAADASRKPITLLGRAGLAGRTAFYAILTALVIRIALLGGPPHHQADANGALLLVSRPTIGKVAIAVVALGFVLFGVGRIAGAVGDHSVSTGRRAMTAAQGLFYIALAYVPAAFLSGNHQTGSQQQQQHTATEILHLPGGRVLLGVLGGIAIAICAVQIRGALRRDFQDGLDLNHAPRVTRRVAMTAGPVGITARSLVFLPVGIFLIVAAVQADPGHAYGTDRELLDLANHAWGVVLLALVAAGLLVFVIFSAIETRYRIIVSAR